LEFCNEEIFLHKNSIESSLCDYYSDAELQVSRTKAKRCSADELEVYKLEVWIKGMQGKKKLSFLVRRHEETDKECSVYKSIIEEVRAYLATKQDVNRKYLPVPDAFVCHNSDDNQDNCSDFFMIEDMRNLGYRADVLADTGRGLDYEHSIVAIAALARFHAASYCWRRETGADLKNASSLLRDEKLPAAAASDDFLREIGEILESSGFEKYSGQFLCAARGDIGTMSQKLSKFGVVCHGGVARPSLMFKYRHQGDAKQLCQEAALLSLDKCFYGSCVLDLVQFLFSCVDTDVRQSFMADFICSVYYDNLARAVTLISPALALFSKKEFIVEVAARISLGFAETVSRLAEDEDRAVVRSCVVAAARDIVQFKLNAEVTIK